MTFYIRLAFTSGLALRIKGVAYFTKSQLSETDNSLQRSLQAKILDIVLEKYPELHPYVKICYAKTSHLWWMGTG
jgi:hypothetical protein